MFSNLFKVYGDPLKTESDDLLTVKQLCFNTDVGVE